jgi:D-sedoheptulose 7-phosphate isomerase
MSLDHPFIAERIADAMQSLGGLAEDLPPFIIVAGLNMAQQLINERKNLALGFDSFAPFPQLFCNSLMYNNAQQRPALPALLLNDNTCSTAIAAGESADSWAIRPLQAFGQAGDVLLILAESANTHSVQTAVTAALGNNISCVVIAADGISQDSSSVNNDSNAIYLSLDSVNLTRMHELTLFILNCLNDIIDAQLFGSY